MRRIAAILIIAASLAACGFFGELVDGWKHAKAVETDLEKSVGLKPHVGFKWSNGRLVLVTVSFPELYDKVPVRELAEVVRASVITQFRQRPENIELAFWLGKS